MVRRPPCLGHETYDCFSERSTVVRGLCYSLFLAASSLWLLLGLGDDNPTIPQHSGEHPFMCLLPLSPSLDGSTLHRRSLLDGLLGHREVHSFLPVDTNFVLREFEKCGLVLRHVPGPRDANWMHILYQSRHDAQKALAKHGQQLNSVLIIGVKQVDPWQRPYLNENTDDTYNGGMSVPFPSQAVAPSGFATRNALAPLPSNSMQNGNESNRGASGAIASPAKSVLSKVMDVMFGL